MNSVCFIIPCYNEEVTIGVVHEAVCKTMKSELPQVEYSFLLVDDGSTDKTLEKIKTLAKKDSKIKYISFSRNFGKEAAMLAGLKNAKADYICLLDADMQDPPSLIPQMYTDLESGNYDCVCSRRINRIGEPKIRAMFARLFYKFMNNIDIVKLKGGCRDFLMMNQAVRDSIVSVGEYVRFFKGLFVWVGFRRKWLGYENINRTAGESKWSFWGLTKYALIAISSFTIQPLIWPFFLGVVLGIAGLLTMWINFMAGLIMVLFAVQMVFMGIFGYYIATIFLETKKRPPYLIRETNVEK